MTPVVAVGAIVFDASEAVLLVCRANPPGQGLWSIPGGKVCFNERLVDAVRREAREETGLEVEVGPLACVIERVTDGYHYVILDYVARVVGGALTAASDAHAARFVPPDELAGLPLTEGLLGVLAQARATHGPWFTSPSSPIPPR